MMVTTVTSPRVRRRGGYTVIELLIVVTIVGILVALGLPRFGATIARDRARRAQLVVASDMERAFLYAQRVRRPVVIDFVTSGQRYRVVDRVNNTVLFRRTAQQMAEYQLSSVSFPSSNITVFPTGLSTGSFTITLTTRGATRTIQVTRTGQVIKS